MPGVPKTAMSSDSPASMPLTQGQLSIWFAQALAPRDPAYNIGECIEIGGKLAADKFERALRHAVAATDALNLRFADSEAGPRQWVACDQDWELVRLDLGGDDPEQAAADWMRRDMAMPFCLEGDRLFRFALLRLSRERYFWYAVNHHIINDGVGWRLLQRRVAEAYTALCEDRALPPADAGAWRDIVAEEKGYKSSDHYRRDRAYWMAQLADAPARVTLSREPPRPPQGFVKTTGYLPHCVSLEDMAQRHGASAAAVFAAAAGIYVHRMTGAPAMIIGVPMAARVGGRSRAIVGMAANAVPLRLAIDAADSIGSVIAETGRGMRAAVRHQRYRLEDIRRDQGLAPSDPDICGTYVNFTPFEQDIRFAGHSIINRPLGNWRLEDLQLVYYGGTEPGGQRIDVVANAAVYSEADTEQHCRRFLDLLRQLASAKTDAPVRSIALLSPAERHTILEDWNGQDHPIPDATVWDLFKQQAHRHAEAVALVSGERSMSYGELAEQASRLAGCLAARGIGRGDRVALAVPRSLEMVVSLLAILKSGAAFVPLDPDYPPARIAYMLDDSKSALALVTSETAHLLPRDAARLSLDDPALREELLRRIDASADAARGDRIHPADPAYIVYTSGSTGQPKGVVGLHLGLLNRLAWMAAAYPFEGAGPTIAKSSLSFIDGTTELLGPLSAGASVVLAPPRAAGDPSTLAELIARHAIGRITVVPSQLAAILDAAMPGQLASCKLWLTSGAALPRQLGERFHAGLPQSRLVNLYGMSEASGDSLFAECGPGETSIGRPIWNTRVYVLDSSLEPVPAGVAGEIHIAGKGLAAGYWNRGELTAERFVPDPHGEPGSRMYRTGDLGRWRPDGTIEFLGRADEQIKINGIRVELGEIEAALKSFAGVADAAVVARDEGSSTRQLVAFAEVPAGKRTPGDAELRAHLTSLLPEPIVPALLNVTHALPRLPNGKLDRRKLRAEAAASMVADGTAEARLRTPTELALAEIWGDVLRRPAPGRNGDFFALGGDSLRAAQVLSRIRRMFAVDLPLAAIFEARSLEALAGRVDTVVMSSKGARPAPKIVPLAGTDKALLSFSQQRMWIIQSLEPEATAYNMLGALHLSGPLDAEALSDAVERIVSRHEILRTTYRVVDGEVVQQASPHCRQKLETIDLTATEPDPRAAAWQLAAATARRPFDLVNGPTMRNSLMRIGAEEHLLLLGIHHISGDQWSSGVIGRELAALYNAFRKGEPPPDLPALPVTYRDFAAWQRTHFGGDALDEQIGYWRRALQGTSPLDLPVDKSRPRLPTLRGDYVRVPVPASLFAALDELGRRESATLFMTMLAGFAALLQRWSGQADFCVGVPVANRTHDTIENVVGTFVNLLALRADLSGNPTFSELIARVRTTALDGFVHQDVPFDRLVQLLAPSRDTGRPPLAQVLFNVLNAPLHGIELDGLTWQPEPFHTGGAQFELGVSVDRQITGTLSVEFNADLFERATIERLVERYFCLLARAAAAPSTRLADLELLPDEERRIVLHDWNATAAPLPPVTFVEMFERRVAEQPDAAAMTFRGVALSYGALNARANALALELEQAGAGPGARVGICMERSPAMLVALLAVQKAGGIYVPIEPGLPPQRIAHMILDSGLGTLLVGGPAAKALDVPDGVVVIDAERFSAPDAPALADNRAPRARPADAAYIIYTSGSTGKPKGVRVSHGALTNFLLSMQREPGLRKGDVLAAVTTISFDIAGLELYLPLLCGARIELVPSTVAADARALADLLDARQITVMQATPATWRMLVESGWRGGPQLRALCGGEALPSDLAVALLERVGELWNLYGPTETTIWSTAARIGKGEAAINIGRPIANTQVYILDGLSPAPIGAIGEICIGGAGVALGYEGRDDLTAERFVADPFSTEPGARMYRTGDLGRWGADGRLYHLGRMDHQVKIRGFRVETGEIEAVLDEHSAVRQSVVATWVAGPGDVRLVAYVVSAANETLTVADARRHLRERLPDYMIPAIVVPMNELPRTANGKLDRNALPDPFAHAARPAAFEPPASGTEADIAELWSRLLKLDKVGAEDNFFDLGGDSLLALRFAAEFERKSGIRIDPRNLFFHKLRDLAALHVDNPEPPG